MVVGKRGRMARKQGSTRFLKKGRRAMAAMGVTGGFTSTRSMPALRNRVNRLYRMIETKESGSGNPVNVGLAHNQATVMSIGPVATTLGTGDLMAGLGQRIGDRITIIGVKAKIFLEAALGRSKVYFRVMLLKGHRGASFSRADIYKGAAANKMLDDINTEKYTIIAQKTVTVTPPNAPADALNAVNGEVNQTLPSGITGNRILKFWIPGKRICRNGDLTYEDSSTIPKFFDYRWVIVAYDWYGTPQDLNTVGIVNEFYNKMYFKDA